MKFSVSMCVYYGDDSEHFCQAVNSVLNQTAKPDEIVIVVDGPVPSELENELEIFAKDPIFNIVRLKENTGHGNARRTGLDNCRNGLVALMDADDISLPDRFGKQLLCFEQNPDVSVVGGQIAEFCGKVDNIVGIRKVPENHTDIVNYMKKRCPMNQVSVMFKKADVDAAGGYIDWFCDEDYYLWIRMYLADMKFANVDDVLVNVRVEPDMYRRRGGMKYFRSEAALQKLMRKNRIIGPFTCFSNIMKRFILQVLMPNGLRSWAFRKFARQRG